jgi:DeoR family transcriptional regulator, fructose operon transcriptional repressor
MAKNGQFNDRWDKIIRLVDEHGYLSVKNLSQLCSASEITIRRDLETLTDQKRILRTHGGAASLRDHAQLFSSPDSNQPVTHLLERVDALISSTNTERILSLIPEKFSTRFMPVIAEATPSPNALTCVTIDNYAACKAIGRWAGEYANRNWGGNAFVLALTYHLPNTIERSRGFFDGLCEIVPTAQQLFSLNAHSRHETAYQLTNDAIKTDPRINIIFAINDQSALGAIRACTDLRLDAKNLMVIPCGLEGNIMRDLMVDSPFCKGGLAMFPEIVGQVCLEAAVSAYNHQDLPAQLITPFAVVEKSNLHKFYRKEAGVWKICPEVLSNLILPLSILNGKKRKQLKVPRRIGIVVSFWEHEWYKNLSASLSDYGKLFDIDVELVDAEQTIKDEIELRRREIARRAVEEIQAGEVVFIDASPMAACVAEALCKKRGITVITNSLTVQECLKNCPDLTLVGTGGVLRNSSQAFVGPTAEHAIREMRVDHLFLTVSGVSVNFGLSHTNISEVTIKQTMIKSARQVILLADHSMFQSESTIQVAPLSVVHRLITDDVLPASARVQISQLGIQVVVAGM